MEDRHASDDDDLFGDAFGDFFGGGFEFESHTTSQGMYVVTYVLVVKFTSLFTKVTEVNVVKLSLRELVTQLQHKLHAHKCL